MIIFRSAHRDIKKGKSRLPVLKDESFVFDLPRVGLVSSHREVSERLIDLMAGYISLERGSLWRFGRVSWPLNRMVQFRSDLTGRATLHFFCDIYGLDFHRSERVIRQLIDFKREFDRPTVEWPNTLILEFSYAAYLLPEFEIYLAEGSINTSDEFMTRWKPLFERKIEGRTFIFTCAYAHRLSPFVEKVVVANHGKLSLYSSVDLAFTALGEIGVDANQASSPEPPKRVVDEMLF